MAKDCPNPASLSDVNCLVEYLEVNALKDAFLSDTDRVAAYNRAHEQLVNARCVENITPTNARFTMRQWTGHPPNFEAAGNLWT